MAYIKTITVDNTTYNLSLPEGSVGSGLTINETEDNNFLSVYLGDGLEFDGNKRVTIKPYNGITCNQNGISLNVNEIFDFNDNKTLKIKLGSGLTDADNDGNFNLHVKLGSGLEFSNAYEREGIIDLKLGSGLQFGDADEKGCVPIEFDTDWLKQFINDNFNLQPLL